MVVALDICVLNYVVALGSMVKGAIRIFGTPDSEVRDALNYFCCTGLRSEML